MNDKFIFFLFLIFSFDLLAGTDVVDENGIPGYLFDDGTFASYDVICESAANNGVVNATKEVVIDKKTNQPIVVDCDKQLYPLNSEQSIDNEKENQPPKLILDNSKSTDNFTDFTSEQKYPLLVGSLALGIYGYLISKLYKSKKYINKTITWSCFKKNVPIEVLYEIPEDKFLHDLMEVIYRTFSENKNNPNYDDIEPLYLFIKAAQKEIKKLDSFITLYWYLKLPVISLIFPNLDDELILAQEKIEKLSYMQDLVTNKICAMNS